MHRQNRKYQFAFIDRVIERDYPGPVVEHRAAKERAIGQFRV